MRNHITFRSPKKQLKEMEIAPTYIEKYDPLPSLSAANLRDSINRRRGEFETTHPFRQPEKLILERLFEEKIVSLKKIQQVMDSLIIEQQEYMDKFKEHDELPIDLTAQEIPF